ncbi:MAG: ABC transporter ATP-binding protein [Candidatus Poseidoniaceae archaeon]|jgi:ATP-binding cassette subfamily B protein|nr:ABC transporter ATP-binding protein [Candidatus Poseidoniaceae archaeon]
MGAGNPRAAQYDHLSPEQLNRKISVLGKQIWRVVPYALQYKSRAITGMISNGLARFSDLLPFVFIGFAVDYYSGIDTEGPYGVFRDWLDGSVFPLITDNLAVGYGILIFLGFASLSIFQGISEYCWQTLGYKVQHDLRLDATRSLIEMEASYYDLRQTGQLMSVLSADVNQLEDVISDASTSIIRIIVTFATAFLLLILMSWKLAAVLFAPLTLIVPLVYLFSTRVQKKYRQQRESTGDITAVLENMISGISVVQAYNAQEWEANRVTQESLAYRDQAISASKVRNRFLPGLYWIAGIAFGLLVTVGGYLTNSGEITTGQLVTFLLISTRMTMPMFIFGMLVNQLQKGEASARRVFALVDLEPNIKDSEDAINLKEPISTIEFKKVDFTYPGTSIKVLAGISFKVDAGEFVGIMGHTGAGKTTILKLLMRYYVPDSGQVLVNGIDVNELTLDSVRHQMGFVSQEPFLFFGTLKENVAYNRESTDEEIISALEMAGAVGFLSELEDGLETMVGDRGTKLSGGQRARVSLARALLKSPSLLVLDEASSALDAETEKRIQENLLASGGSRTTIAVAHRLSTIRNAEEIISMVDGAIVERGTHEQLIESDGVYASQWLIQTGEQ